MENVATEAEMDSMLSAINNLGNFANNYGFMMLFSVIILLLVLVASIIFLTRMSKKSQNELELTSKERTQVMDHTDKIYDLLYTVQTKQVADLDLIAEKLKDTTAKVDSTNLTMITIEHDVTSIKNTVGSVDEKTTMIVSSISDILDKVKLANQCNQDILNKISIIESIVYTDHNRQKQLTVTSEGPNDSLIEAESNNRVNF